MRKQQSHNTELPRAESSLEAADRRRSPRERHRVMFNIRPVLAGGAGVGAPVEVILQDLSISGMGVIHTVALEGQYEIPLLRGEADAGPMALLATVVRCERLDDGLFSIGFEFNSSTAMVDEGSRQLTGRPAPRD